MELTPQIYFSEKHKVSVENYIKENNLDNKIIKVAIFLTGITSRTLLPSKVIIDIINYLTNKNYTVILCGSKQDYNYLHATNCSLKNKVLLNAGHFDILSLGYFLSKCNLVFCPDSGPRHLANAVDTPVLFYRNLRLSKIEVGEYSKNEEDMFNFLECEYLSKKEFSKILSGLDTAKICYAIEKILTKQLSTLNRISLI